MYGDEIATLVGRLNSKDETVRASADRQLRALSLADIDNLLVWSRSCDSGQQMMNGCNGCAAAGCGVVGVGALTSALFVLITRPNDLLVSLVMAVTALTIAFSAGKLIRGRDGSVESEALARVDNPEVSAPILHNLFSLNPPVRKSATDALIRLLPKLKASDSARFPRSARNAIHRLFLSDGGYGFRLELVLTAIYALQQIGDSSSEKALERLLKQPTYNKRDGRIHAAAQPVLEALKLRLNEERQANTLLRSAAFKSVGTLLHPSSNLPAEDSDTLLRPLSQEESEW